MARIESPCKNCVRRVTGEDRDKGCHSHCEEYKKFQKLSAKDKEAYHKSLIWDKCYESQVKKTKRKK